MTTWIKICGVTSAGDARFAADAGADAIGLNFVETSVRRLDASRASDIVARCRDLLGRSPHFVGVFANQRRDRVLAMARSVGLDSLQLHGDESPEDLDWFKSEGMMAFKAIRVSDSSDVTHAAQFGGDVLLVDSKVGGALGGTGHTFDWSLISELSRARRLILAGGLTPKNVAVAVRTLAPYGVDTASGVESAPGVKDEGLVRAFIQACRAVPAPGDSA